MVAYIALIRKEHGSCYGVEFPDFPGCISGGDTLDEAVRSAESALDFHIRGMLEDCEEIPAPTSVEDILSDPENRGGVLQYSVINMPSACIDLGFDVLNTFSSQ